MKTKGKKKRERKRDKSVVVPPVSTGCKRAWYRCKRCSKVYWRDYVPYSLSNPIIYLPCGHDGGGRFLDAVDEITADEALVALNQRPGR